MKRFILFFLAVSISLPLLAQRNRIDIPDLQGYLTLQCDFHLHTVFSDGTVWPAVRVDEARNEGLDAISITDHLESRRQLSEIERMSGLSLKTISHNISYDIAKPRADQSGLILIRGTEITRSMPPGHCNAIFISNADEIEKPDYMDAFRVAKAQGAFIFFNHPGFPIPPQQSDTAMWWPIHTQLLKQGMIHGIEVVNDHNYSLEAHRWCLDNNLTMMGTTDAHGPRPPFGHGVHRTMNFIFAKERSAEAIREALFERRTAVYWNENVIGEEKYLMELFKNALDWDMRKNGNAVTVTVRNKSDLTFRLKKTSQGPGILHYRDDSIARFIIPPKGSFRFIVRLLDDKQNCDLNFVVDNFLVQPNEGMNFTLNVK